MQGLSLSSLKKHPALIPLFACLGVGVAASAFYTLRLASRNPDVTWSTKKNPEPQNAYKARNYKFYDPTGNAPTQSPAPTY